MLFRQIARAAPRRAMDRQELRCNICDQIVEHGMVAQHVAGRNHSIRKKVAEFNEMNAQVKPSYRNDISTVRAWIRDLYKYDYLSSGATTNTTNTATT